MINTISLNRPKTSLIIIAPLFFLAINCKQKNLVYTVPDAAMENTLKMNDRYKIQHQENYRKNDIIYFGIDYTSEYGARLDSNIALRLVGCPKDSIFISAAKIYINNIEEKREKGCKYPYITETNNFPTYDSLLAFINHYSGSHLAGNFSLLNLDSIEYLKIKNTRVTIPLQEAKLINYHDTTVNFQVKLFVKVKDTLPPIYIPEKGDTVTINSSNVKYYYLSLKHFEKLSATKYVAKEDMYFVIADNWAHAYDSRDFGLITKKQVIGKLVKY